MGFFKKQGVVRAEKAKTPAFFCKMPLVKIDRLALEDLKKISKESGDQDVRICLHDSPENAFHDMVILQHSGRYYRPHRHTAKSETLHLIEGALRIVIFDDNGVVQEVGDLQQGGGVLYRIGNRYFHTVLPMSPVVLYHEAKTGPFLGDQEFQFPEWAPDGKDPIAANAFLENLVRFK